MQGEIGDAILLQNNQQSSNALVDGGTAQLSDVQLRAVFPRQVQNASDLAAIRCVILRLTGPDLKPRLVDHRILTRLEDTIVFAGQIPVGSSRVFTVELFAEEEAYQTEVPVPEFIPTSRGEKEADIPPTRATVTVEMALV